LSDFNEASIFSTELRKILNIKFHENSSRGRRGFPCHQTDGHTNIDAFRNFATPPPKKKTRGLNRGTLHVQLQQFQVVSFSLSPP